MLWRSSQTFRLFFFLFVVMTAEGLGQICSHGITQRLNLWWTGYRGNPVEKLATPVELSDPEDLGIFAVKVFETGRIGLGNNLSVNRIIEKLAYWEGELRIVDTLGLFGGENSLGHFRITREGRPIIGIDRSADLGVLAHEEIHFDGWAKRVTAMLAYGEVLSYAAHEASRGRRAEAIEREEELAVQAELSVRNWTVFDRRLIPRLVYPHIRGARVKFVELSTERTRASDSLLEPFAERAIGKVITVLQQRQRLRPRRFTSTALEKLCALEELYRLMGVRPSQQMMQRLLRAKYSVYESACRNLNHS